MLSVSLERTEYTGQLWFARRTNGRIAGAHLVYPKINSVYLKIMIKDQDQVKVIKCFPEDRYYTPREAEA
ncbi:hypothetical protein ANCDUO_02737 [Ancylostoma duodenale]|uniref:Uncharacterized protein n=1 Tax=Ancylostoma duodenale TaxID=51022 RepID=A0A0C2H5Y2_9BILA|nr:hypothetical protein ANCDUO_02737 [Ancylostoma duodenale]